MIAYNHNGSNTYHHHSTKVARETITLFSMFVSPLLIILPALLAKYTNGPRPLFVARIGYACK